MRIRYNFPGNPNNEELGRIYKDVFGETLEQADWLRILNEATEASILEHLDSTIYKIHPALPWYLRQKLAETHSEEIISELEKKLLWHYSSLANYYAKVKNTVFVETSGLSENDKLDLQQRGAIFVLMPLDSI